MHGEKFYQLHAADISMEAIASLMSKCWSEPSSISILCVCKQGMLGQVCTFAQTSVLTDAIGTQILCIGPFIQIDAIGEWDMI